MEVDSLAPLDILIITEFLIIQSQKQCKISISTNPIIRKYVNDIRLVDFVKFNTYNPKTIRAILSASAMPIRRVESENMFYYINTTETFFKSICKNKDLAMLNQSMSELINNVYDHSKSEIGAYVFCQYYSETNEIKIAVSDYGIGIPESVNKFMQEKGNAKLSEIDCVKWALEEKKSTHSIPRNKGLGLDNVNSFINQNKGKWKLISGNVFMSGDQRDNKFYKNFIDEFKGTAVELTIQIDNLEDVNILNDLSWD